MKTVAVDEIDFDTNLNPPDFNGERRFDIVDNGVLYESAIRHFTRKGAKGFVKSGKSKFSRDAEVYELGIWQKHIKDGIIARREEQIRAINRQNSLGLRKAGPAVDAAIRSGFFDAISKNQVIKHAGGVGLGYERNSKSIARVRESDLFGVRGTDVNGVHGV